MLIDKLKAPLQNALDQSGDPNWKPPRARNPVTPAMRRKREDQRRKDRLAYARRMKKAR